MCPTRIKYNVYPRTSENENGTSEENLTYNNFQRQLDIPEIILCFWRMHIYDSRLQRAIFICHVTSKAYCANFGAAGTLFFPT